MAIAKGVYTIIDLSDITISNTAPVNPVLDHLWLDTSITPNQLKRWNGSAWVRAGASNLEELDPDAAQIIESHTTAINALAQSILLKVDSQTYAQDMQGINTVLNSHSASINVMADEISQKVSHTDLEEAETNVITQLNTQIEQTSSTISAVIDEKISTAQSIIESSYRAEIELTKQNFEITFTSIAAAQGETDTKLEEVRSHFVFGDDLEIMHSDSDIRMALGHNRAGFKQDGANGPEWGSYWDGAERTMYLHSATIRKYKLDTDESYPDHLTFRYIGGV